MKWSACHELGAKKKSESPIGFKPMSSHRAGALSSELRRTRGEQGHILGSYLTRALHTARISNVVLYDERMKDGGFKARWNKCKDEIISVSRAWGKEKIWVFPDRIRTYYLPNTGRMLYPLELLKTQGERGQLYQVHAWHASCLLHNVQFSYSSNTGTVSWINSNLSFVLLNCSLLRYG